MNKIKKFFIGAAAGAMLLTNMVLPAAAVAPWNVTGNYEITFFDDADITNTPYVHHAELTQTGSNVTGDGGYPATGAETYHWNVTSGTQTVDSINLTVVYDLGAVGTTMNMTGSIASDGTVSGTWSDNFGGPRTGTWSITKGVSTPAIHTPANNAVVTSAALTEVDWTDSVGSNPPFQYHYQAFSDAGYTTLVYSSGWLTDSEIPTPGTPPGDYYLRVMARDEAEVGSAWSNGASNPYKITVTANDVTPTPTDTPTPTPPLNAFNVPAQCDQNVAYNLIEGTSGSEVLNGTNGPDMIYAGGGSDVVNGKGGADCIVGGAGSDYIIAGNGDDVVLGGTESDSINGNDGADKLYGGAGSDAIRGNDGPDQLFGNDGSDSLQGNGGVDTADGGAGSDACNAETEAASCEA